MNKALNGKIALVTGASRGIGSTVAKRLAVEGASVIINYLSQEAKANEVLRAIEEVGGQARTIQADISKTTDVRRLFDESQRHYGSIDILVNNAGAILYKPIIETEEDEFDRVFDINVKGTFVACREAAKRMREGGRIINFSSSVTALMFPTYGVYAASKGAVEQLTRVLAKEIGHKQITVNSISPGPTETELFFEGKSEEQIMRLSQMAALGRLGKPDDIASVVAFLAGPDARWVTGQNIRVNGGFA